MQNNPTQLENLNQAIRKYNQALAYCQQGSLDLAVIQLKKVLSINPRFLRAHQLLALLYIQAEDWEKAKRELNKCGRIDVRNTTTLRYMKEVDAATVEDESKGAHRSRKSEDVIKYQSGNETIIQPVMYRSLRKVFLPGLSAGGRGRGLAIALTLIMPARCRACGRSSMRKAGLWESSWIRETRSCELQAQVTELQTQNTELTMSWTAMRGQTVHSDGGGLLNAAYIYLDTPDDITAWRKRWND